MPHARRGWASVRRGHAHNTIDATQRDLTQQATNHSPHPPPRLFLPPLSFRGGGGRVHVLAKRAGGVRGLRLGLHDPLLRHWRRPLARLPPQEQ